MIPLKDLLGEDIEAFNKSSVFLGGLLESPQMSTFLKTLSRANIKTVNIAAYNELLLNAVITHKGNINFMEPISIIYLISILQEVYNIFDSIEGSNIKPDHSLIDRIDRIMYPCFEGGEIKSFNS